MTISASSLIYILLGYLIGSISSSIITARLMNLPDPRSLGSGNPGATNMLRTGNKKAAGITLVGDLLKSLIPLLVAHALNVDILVLCMVGLAAILGHMYPIYYRFSGGKGVATTVGALTGIYWPLAAIWIIGWLITARISGYSSLAALVATTLTPVASMALHQHAIVTMTCVLIAIIVAWRHRGNINRLLKGEESKIKFRSD